MGRFVHKNGTHQTGTTHKEMTWSYGSFGMNGKLAVYQFVLMKLLSDSENPITAICLPLFDLLRYHFYTSCDGSLCTSTNMLPVLLMILCLIFLVKYISFDWYSCINTVVNQ